MKTCTSCGEDRPLTEYAKRKASADGLAYKCKPCVSEYNRKYREAHRDELVEYSRKWHSENREYMRQYHIDNRERRLNYYNEWKLSNRDKRRATEQARRARKMNAGGSFTDKEWQAKLEEFEGRCAYCPGEAEHIDHIVPVSKGGTSFIWNLIPACASCNLSKRDRSLEEWRGGEFKHLIPKEWMVND